MSTLKEIKRDALKKALTLVVGDKVLLKARRDSFLGVLAHKHFEAGVAEGQPLDVIFDDWNNLMVEVVAEIKKKGLH
jgi:hypothetical protein